MRCVTGTRQNISSALFVCFKRMRALDIHQSAFAVLQLAIDILLEDKSIGSDIKNPLSELPRENLFLALT